MSNMHAYIPHDFESLSKEVARFAKTRERRIVRTREIRDHITHQFRPPKNKLWTILRELISRGVIFRVQIGKYVHSDRLQDEDIPDILLTHDKLYGLTGLEHLCELVFKAASRQSAKYIEASLTELLADEKYTSWRPVLERFRDEENVHREHIRTYAERLLHLAEEEFTRDLLEKHHQLTEKVQEEINRLIEIEDEKEEQRRHIETQVEKKHYFANFLIDKEVALKYVSRDVVEEKEKERGKLINNLFLAPFQHIPEKAKILLDTCSLIALLRVDEVYRILRTAFIHNEVLVTDEVERELRKVVKREYRGERDKLMQRFDYLKKNDLIDVRWQYHDHEEANITTLDLGEISLLNLFTDLVEVGEQCPVVFVTDEKDSSRSIGEYVQIRGGVFLYGAIALLVALCARCSVEIGAMEKAIDPLTRQIYPNSYVTELPQKKAAMKLLRKKKTQRSMGP